jgi:hypothetical protein
MNQDWSDPSLHVPHDAPARRAHFEQSNQFNAFHDGADTPEIRAKLDAARVKALERLKRRVKKPIKMPPEPS